MLYMIANEQKKTVPTTTLVEWENQYVTIVDILDQNGKVGNRQKYQCLNIVSTFLCFFLHLTLCLASLHECSFLLKLFLLPFFVFMGPLYIFELFFLQLVCSTFVLSFVLTIFQWTITN